eukprot:Skav211840  [mRNA]  locus=scaffold305:781368:784860:+ [translate_table: standard]
MRDWGFEVDAIYNEETRNMDFLPEHTPVYICFKGVPMGWAWALYLAQDIVCHQSLLAINGHAGQLVQDKRKAPSLVPGQGAVGVYVDNVHTFGGSGGEASDMMNKIADRFSSLGIPFEVDGVEGASTVTTLGLTFHFKDGVRVTAKAERAWRLWAATRALVRRRRISGDVLRIWLGHVNFHFLLCRPLLSILSACYKFSASHLGHRFPMWSNVRKELKMVMNLIFVVERNMSAPISQDVHVGDSSDRGYGLLNCWAPRAMVKQEMLVEERWRFIHSREPLHSTTADNGDPWEEPEYDDVVFKGCVGGAGVGSGTSYGQLLKDKVQNTTARKRCSSKCKFLEPRDSTHSNVSLISMPGFPTIAKEWSDESRWNLISAKPWKDITEHINIKEAKVALMGLRRFCRTGRNFGHRCLSLCDNQVAVFAFSKGRSGSSMINNLCKRAAAYQVGCGITWHLRYIASEDNPADGPSRKFGPDLIPKRRQTVYDSLDAHVSIDSFEQGTSTGSASGSGIGADSSKSERTTAKVANGTGDQGGKSEKTLDKQLREAIEPEPMPRSMGSKRNVKRVGLNGEKLSADLGLRALKVTQKTLTRYLTCIKVFEDWARSKRKKTGAKFLDKTVNDYLSFLYQDGAEFSEASYLVYGLQLIRCDVAKQNFLVMSKLSLSGWRKQEPGSMRVPVPEEFIFDVATLAMEKGRLDIAVAMAIQYDGYLRPSECLGLTLQHVNPPHGRRYPHYSLVIAPACLGETTKTGKTDDSLILGDKAHNRKLADVMRLWMANTDDCLFPNLSLSQYEAWFKQACNELQYKSTCIMPHVVRHAGASNDHYHGRRNLVEIQKRGRWMAKSSVARYEKSALLLAAWKQATPTRFKVIEARSQRFFDELLKRLRTAG